MTSFFLDLSLSCNQHLRDSFAIVFKFIHLGKVHTLVWDKMFTYWLQLHTLLPLFLLSIDLYLFSYIFLTKQRALEAPKYPKATPTKEEDEVVDEEDEDEHGETLCGACGENYASDEFWICCDICEKWFHGKCVKITPARAEHIKQYKCPSCSNKRARP